MEGILLINKPPGVTSAKFLNRLKTILNNYGLKKIGHGGTLDKFASGLLVVGMGSKFTKQLHPILKNFPKKYEALVELGRESTTLDPEGTITSVTNSLPTKREIIKALKSFPLNTPFSQIAPLYSAKKLGGRRLSDLTRQNIKVIPRAANVILYNYSLLSYSPPLLNLRLTVSSGFYIRSFTHDLGQKIKSGAYLKELTRLAIGPYQLSQAASLSNLENNLSLTGFLTGKVQGVGFRSFFNQELSRLSLSGYSKNLPAGSLSFSARGPLPALLNLIQTIKTGPKEAVVSDYFLLWQK